MAEFAKLLLALLLMAGGYVAGDWNRARLAVAESALLRANERTALETVAKVETRLQLADRDRATARTTVRSVVAAAPTLRDCTLPPDASRLLADQLAKTRASAAANARTVEGRLRTGNPDRVRGR